MPEQPTVIIGAGVSGIACARELQRLGHTVRVISQDVGGRVTSSSDGQVNYGAYIFGGDNRHIRECSIPGRRLRLSQIRYHGSGPRTWSSWWHHPVAAGTLLMRSLIFRRRFHRFQKRAEQVGQQAALQRDLTLLAMYNEYTDFWLVRHGLTEFVDTYFAPIIRMCTFSELSAVTVFDFFHLMMYLTVPVFEFTVDRAKMMNGVQVIEQGISVTKIIPGSPHTIQMSTNETIRANTVVVALPTEQLINLLPIRTTKTPRTATMYHLRGHCRSEFVHGDIHVFRSPSNNLFLSPQHDGTFLCYRRVPDENFSELFDGQVEIIACKSWKPAFWMGAGTVLDIEPLPNILVAGDHNIVGMEDSWISGLAAAHRVHEQLLEIKAVTS